METSNASPATEAQLHHLPYATDTALSSKARGLLTFLMASPEFQVSADRLAELLPEGREAIRTILRELENHGYVDRRRRRDGDARFTTAANVVTEKAWGRA